jgi:hypothetical protein
VAHHIPSISRSLSEVLARARAAVIGAADPDIQTPTAPIQAAAPAPRGMTVRPIEPPRPLVVVRHPDKMPEAPLWPFCETVAASAALSPGAGRVFAVLHRLAVDVGTARGYGAVPDTVTLHLPASLLALGVGYTPRHLRRLVPELVAAGLVAAGAHASKVNGMSLWDGYLWAVKVQPGDVVPHLRRDEWKHAGWRDFAGDIEVGRTVKALLERMSGLHPEERKKAVETALEAWAVTPSNLIPPVGCRPDIDGGRGLESVRAVVYRLGELADVHPTKRAETVGRLASTLSTAFDDRHSRRWWCSLLWAALEAQREGRHGLAVFTAQLVRLDADRREWAELRNPAALLAARLKATEPIQG